MELQVIGSSPDSPRTRQYASSYTINGTVAIDAGSIGFCGSPQEQSAIRHVFITHSHMDHIASLPTFLDNLYDPGTEAVTLHASAETMAVLQEHIFNNMVWPDFIGMRPPGRPFVHTSLVVPGQIIEVEGLRILPVPVNHIVPTLGYIVSDGHSTVVFGADSGPTDQIWELAATFPEPRTVLVEASFPDNMRWLAEISGHLTPKMVLDESQKMPQTDRILIIHVKPRFRDAIEAELMVLKIDGLSVAVCNGHYSV